MENYTHSGQTDSYWKSPNGKKIKHKDMKEPVLNKDTFWCIQQHLRTKMNKIEDRMGWRPSNKDLATSLFQFQTAVPIKNVYSTVG